MTTRHGVADTDNHFIIDPVTRTIINKSGKLVLIQHDHNSERFTFECPRYVDNHDMSLCDSIQIHYINIGTGSQKSYGIYQSKDINVETINGEETITFSWLVSCNATKHVGKLNFVVRFACYSGSTTTNNDTSHNGVLLVDKSTDDIYDLYVDSGELTMYAVSNVETAMDPRANFTDVYYTEDGRVLEYVWNTGIYSDISISKSIYNSEEFVEDYVDILETWKYELIAAGLRIESVEQTVTSTEDDGINVVSMTMTDGTVETFQFKNGSKGKEGESLTHEWDGTTLKVTSSSGTSSSDLKGAKGDAFTYDMFTPEQLAALKGEAFTYDMFTPEQLAALKGEPGTYIISIERTSGNGAAGSRDEYTITTNDGATFKFSVYNGMDGNGGGGSGDMSKSIYDPNNKSTDIFAYVDEKVASIDISKSFQTMLEEELEDAPNITLSDEQVGTTEVKPASMSMTSGTGDTVTIDPSNGLTFTSNSDATGIVTGLKAPSNDSDAANKKYVDDKFASVNASTPFSYGTEDLEAGVSELETGKFYFVYE